MADLATNPKSEAAKVAPMIVRVMGRVDSARRWEGKTVTRIIAPAADLYSKPSVVEIRSGRSIGRKGDDVDLFARLGGFPGKRFNTKDKETGEVIEVDPAIMYLEAVDQE